MSLLPTTKTKQNFLYLIRALNSHNYRLFFSGQSISLIGTWMARVATWWLVWRLTNSALMVGVVNFVNRVPAFALASFAGVWIDRMDRHRLLVITQALAMLQSFGLAVVAFGSFDNNLKVILLIALCACQGLINAFDSPIRQTFVVDLVENSNDLGNAIALNSSMINLARMIGPSIAGVTVAMVGEGWCFVIDGFSYIAVITSLLMMHINQRKIQKTNKSALAELMEGWRYAIKFMPIRTLLMLLCLFSLVGMPYRVLLPAIAEKTLLGNSVTFGILLGAVAVGALIGAVLLSARHTVQGLDKQIAFSGIIFGVIMALFALSRSLWLSLPLLIIMGLSSMLVYASSNTMLQTIVEEDKRGRIMSLYTVFATGTMSLGSLLMGALSQGIGLTWCFIVCGGCCLIIATLFLRTLPKFRRCVRPVYREKGLLSKTSAARG